MKFRGGLRCACAGILLAIGLATSVFAQMPAAPRGAMMATTLNADLDKSAGMAGKEPSAPDEKPRLAIVNRTGDPAFCDLLFMSLIESGQVDLVERQETDRILNEMEITAWTSADSIGLGRRLNAKGLLFVESDKFLINVRLVETQNGEIVLTTIRENKNADYADIVRDLLAAFRNRFDTLAMGAQDRLYVAVLPIPANGPLAQDRDTLCTFKALLEAHLSDCPRIVLVERQRLPEVIDERPEAESAGADLSHAAYILRARAIRETRLAVELSLQKTDTQETWAFQGDLEEAGVDQAARELAARVAQALAKETPPAADLSNEARNYYAKANVDRRAGRSLQAAEAYEIAWLLNRTNAAYARAFVEAVSTYTVIEGCGTFPQSDSVPPADYMRWIHWLRKAMNAERAANSARQDLWLMSGTRHGFRQWRFLAYPTDRFSPAELERIRNCRAEMRAYFEWFCAEGNNDLLMAYGPLFFESPGPAMDYVRKAAAGMTLTWEHIEKNFFPLVCYWDSRQAGELWREFLDQLAGAESKDEQFAGLAGDCFFEGTFDVNRDLRNESTGRRSSKRLFDWLMDPANMDYAANTSWYVRMRIWSALHGLEPGEQDRAFKLLAGRIGEKDSAMYYLQRRFRLNGQADAPRIRELLGLLLEIHRTGDEEAYAREMDALAGTKWYADLMEEAVRTNEDEFPDVLGGRLLFDSKAHDVDGIFDRFCAVEDNGALWCFWEQGGQSIGVGQVAAQADTARVYSIPVDHATNAVGDVVPAILGDRLYVAFNVRLEGFGIAVVPISLGDSSLELEKRIQLDPPAEGHRGDTYISALIPRADGLFIGLAHGAIYRWTWDSARWDLVCSADSLQPGPLNNRNPYYVFAGTSRGTPEEDAVYFFMLDAQNNENELETFGEIRTTDSFHLWKHDVASKSWTQLRRQTLAARPRSSLEALCPGRFSSRHYVCSARTWNLCLDVATEQLQVGLDSLRGTTGISDLRCEYPSTRIAAFASEQATAPCYAAEFPGGLFQVTHMLPTPEGLVVLVAGLQPGGGVPTKRGLVYLVPWSAIRPPNEGAHPGS